MWLPLRTLCPGICPFSCTYAWYSTAGPLHHPVTKSVDSEREERLETKPFMVPPSSSVQSPGLLHSASGWPGCQQQLSPELSALPVFRGQSDCGSRSRSRQACRWAGVNH
ncbi:hypothetical protein Y1Q_0007696 [Alligator mississippiensis]|uniref:Uncharacterized protein n=1 Tax=Alligator mississippiensis TaxID=8496 RepID=A0A151P9Y7_ALLMI|nr:hypothetical protein Y1Q_0007696 [Alligator mississippiensis]